MNLDVPATSDVSSKEISSHEDNSDLNCASSSPSSFPRTIEKQSEQDGAEYLAGFIAKKFKSKYPYMGNETRKKPIHRLNHWKNGKMSFAILKKPSSSTMPIIT